MASVQKSTHNASSKACQDHHRQVLDVEFWLQEDIASVHTLHQVVGGAIMKVAGSSV